MPPAIVRLKHLVIAGVLAPLLGVSACDSSTSASFVASGKDYLAKRDFAAAIIQLKNAVAKAPNDVEARLLLGEALLATRDAPGAEAQLRKAQAAGAPPERVALPLARALVMQGEFQKALAVLPQPGDGSVSAQQADIETLRGDAYLSLGRTKEAREAYRAALGAKPDHVAATIGLARVETASGESAQGEALLDGILASRPTLPEALLAKADLLANTGRTKAAAAGYEKVIAADPANRAAYLRLIPMLIQDGDVAAARRRVDALKASAAQDGAVLYLEALVSYSEGRLKPARDAVAEVLRTSPDHIPSLLLAGTIAHDSGNYPVAQDYLRRVLASVPSQAYARRVLVSAYLRTGDGARAREALAPLLQAAPDDVGVLLLAGETAQANGERQAAVGYFERAAQRDTQNVAIRVRLGQARLAAGDVKGAVQDLQTASASGPQGFQADIALVTLHLSNAAPDKAIEQANVLARKQPDNPLTYNLRGLAYLARNDRAHAREDFQHSLQLDQTYFPAAHNLALLDRQEGRIADGRKRYEAILAKDPRQEQALVGLLEYLSQSGAPRDQQEAALQKALAANPQSVRLRLLDVSYWLDAGDTQRALASAQQAQGMAPEDTGVLQALGRAQLAAGDTNQAIGTFGRLAGLQPRSAAPLLAQAEALAQAKSYDSARSTLKRALDVQPGNLAAWQGIVKLGIAAGSFEQARADARAMQKALPDPAPGIVAEAQVVQAQGDAAGARTLLQSALEKRPTSALAIAMVGLLVRQGQQREADAFATRWIAQHPQDAEVPVYLGEVNRAAKDYAKAAQWYKAALRARPDQVATLNNLVWTLGEMQDPAAIEYGQKVLKLAPSQPAVLDTVGWAEVQQGRVEAGLPLLQKAHALAPASAAIELNLAKALLKAGRQDAAREHLVALSRLPAGSPVRKEAEQLLALR